MQVVFIPELKKAPITTAMQVENDLKFIK